MWVCAIINALWDHSDTVCNLQTLFFLRSNCQWEKMQWDRELLRAWFSLVSYLSPLKNIDRPTILCPLPSLPIPKISRYLLRGSALNLVKPSLFTTIYIILHHHFSNGFSKAGTQPRIVLYVSFLFMHLFSASNDLSMVQGSKPSHYYSVHVCIVGIFCLHIKHYFREATSPWARLAINALLHREP